MIGIGSTIGDELHAILKQYFVPGQAISRASAIDALEQCSLQERPVVERWIANVDRLTAGSPK